MGGGHGQLLRSCDIMNRALVRLCNGMPLLTLSGVDGNALVGVLTSGTKAGGGARDWDGCKVLLINRRAGGGRGSDMFLFQPPGFVKLYLKRSGFVVDGQVRRKPANGGGGPWMKLWGTNRRDGGGAGRRGGQWGTGGWETRGTGALVTQSVPEGWGTRERAGWESGARIGP
jgi:hypothetical protein